MARHRDLFPIERMCRVLGVSRSGFYAWQRRGPSHRAEQTERVREHIRTVHQASRGIYGAPRPLLGEPLLQLPKNTCIDLI